MLNGTRSGGIGDPADNNLLRIYFKYLIVGSIFLLLITLISFPLQGRGRLSHLLFQFGLAGENNFGAWWSGMLLFLSAVHAFDGKWRKDLSSTGPRGWLMLSLILLLLSFDEVSSVHEWVSFTVGNMFWIPLGISGAAMLAYSLLNLSRAGLQRSHIIAIAMAFGLFGSVVIQEHIQWNWTWDNPYIYGVRALIEEGTEVFAMLLLLYVTKANTQNLLVTDPEKAIGVVHIYAKAVLAIALILLPILVAASFVLPFPGGPADWLASATFMLAACVIFFEILIRRNTVGPKYWLLLTALIAGSMQANAIRLSYDPQIFGVTASLRGVTISIMLPLIWLLLRGFGLRINLTILAVTSACLLILAFNSNAQLIWVTVPPIVAISVYSAAVKIDHKKSN